MSLTGPPPTQRPLRLTVPSGSLGAGSALAGGRLTSWPSAPTPPSGLSPRPAPAPRPCPAPAPRPCGAWAASGTTIATTETNTSSCRTIPSGLSVCLPGPKGPGLHCLLRGTAVVRRAAEERTAVSRDHGTGVAAERGHLRGIASHGHGVANLQRPARPAVARERARARQLHVPRHHLAALVGGVDVEPGVGIGPFNLRDRALDVEGLGAVVLGGERMMRGQ